MKTASIFCRYLRDVLGLVTQLKEQKHCKICLILNDEALNDTQSDFRTYFEKVIDTHLRFDPTPQESTSIALDPQHPNTTSITRSCTLLNVANIRLIKKIEHATQRATSFLRNYHPAITEQAIQSLALFAWSIYDPQHAPPPDFLRSRAIYITRQERDQITPREATWNALLDTYGFLVMDDLDTALLAGLLNGYFDPTTIHQHATVLDKNREHSDAGTAMEQAWALYHDSFDNNQEQALDAIHQAFLTNITHIDAVNLSGTIGLFKELGRPAQATEMLNSYITAHRDKPGIFDLAHHPFRNRITDPDLVTAFDQQHANTTTESTNAASILRQMAERRGWHPDDLALLATISADEYSTIFKSMHPMNPSGG